MSDSIKVATVVVGAVILGYLLGRDRGHTQGYFDGHRRGVADGYQAGEDDGFRDGVCEAVRCCRDPDSPMHQRAARIIEEVFQIDSGEGQYEG